MFVLWRNAQISRWRGAAALGILLAAGVAAIVGCPDAPPAPSPTPDPTYPYICENGTAAGGDATDATTERCAVCAYGFILNARLRCRPALAFVQNVTDDTDLQLLSARSVTTAVVGGATYLFVTGARDDGVSVFSVGSGGALASVQNVTDDAELQLAGTQVATTAAVGSATYLFVAGADDDGISVFSVGRDGALTPVDSVTDTAPDANTPDTDTLQLDGARSVTTAAVGSATYLFAAGIDDDGVSVFSVGRDGTLTPVDNVADAGALELDGAASVATATVEGATYLYVAGFEDDGVSVFSVGSDGTLASVQNVADTAPDTTTADADTADTAAPDADTLQLDGAVSVATAIIGGATYLFVAGSWDNGVSVFSVGADGTLASVQNVADDAELQLLGTSSVATAAVGSATYLFVAGLLDNGVSVFSVGK